MATQPVTDQTSREYQEQLVKSGRSTLLAILLFSVVNLVLLLMDTGTYFLFSAAVPYYLTSFGKVLDSSLLSSSGTLGGSYTATALVISAVILAVYLAVWLLSKKRPGWLTVGAVLFTVDTAALVLFAFGLLDNPVSCLIDLVFHAIAIWQLFRAAIAARKLKTMPEAVPDPDPSALPGTGE